MNFNLEDLKPLADLLLEKGAPLLATALLGPMGGMIAAAVVPSLVQAFGLAPTATIPELTTAVAADTGAAEKVAAVQDAHSELLDFTQKAIDANQNAIALEPSFWGRLFVGGWRPAMGWAGVMTVIYQSFASVGKFPLLPLDMYMTTLGLWGGLAGVRTVETIKGVARTTLTSLMPSRKGR